MSAPAGGRMSWADVADGPLADVTCLWQDLDGVHVEAAPASPPLTSILWGWHEDYLVRVRLDGATAYVAVHEPAGDATRLLGWDAGDHRVDAGRGRGPSAEQGGLGAEYEQVVVDGIAGQAGPVTFLRPAR